MIEPQRYLMFVIKLWFRYEVLKGHLKNKIAWSIKLCELMQVERLFKKVNFYVSMWFKNIEVLSIKLS